MASCFRFLNRQSDLKKQLKDDAAELMAQMPELTENQAYIRAAKALLNEVVTQRDEVNQAVYDSYIKTAEGKKAVKQRGLKDENDTRAKQNSSDVSKTSNQSGVPTKEPGSFKQEGDTNSQAELQAGQSGVDAANTGSGKGAKVSTASGLAGQQANDSSEYDVKPSTSQDGRLPGNTGPTDDGINNFSLVDKPNIALTPAKRRDINNLAVEILKKPVEDITEADKDILRQYTGSGGLSAKDSVDKGAGIFNQHYTDYTTIKEMYRAMEDAGISPQKALEPSVGSGNFIGMFPEADWSAVDIDEINTEIVKRLYPKAKVFNESYETFKGKNFDLIISNVPFASFSSLPRKHASTVKPAFKAIHNFFFAQSVDKLKDNGIMAFMTSTGTMDGIGEAKRLRQHLVSEMDVIGAFRLPMGTQKANASTDVMIDVIFLQKRPDGVESKQSEKNDSFVNVTSKDGHKINQYFLDYPDSVLGDLSIGKNKTSMGKIEWIVTGDADYSRMQLEKQEYSSSKSDEKSLFTNHEEAKAYADDNRLVFDGEHSTPYFNDGVVYDKVIAFSDVEGKALLGRKVKGANAAKLAALKEIEATLNPNLVNDYKANNEKPPHKDKALKAWAKRNYADKILNSYLSLFDEDYNLSEIFTEQVRFKDSGKLAVTSDSPLSDRAESLEDADGIFKTDNDLVTNDEIQVLLDGGSYARIDDKRIQNARLYYSGNIYKKIDALSKVKPASQRNKQLSKLESIKPKLIPIDRISITGKESWLPEAAIASIGKKTYRDGTIIIGENAIEDNHHLHLFNQYLNNQPLVKKGKEDTQEEHNERVKAAQDTLTDEVLPLIKQKLMDDGLADEVVDAHNRHINFFAPPVFDGSSLKNLPKKFRGKDFNLMQHQQQGAERAIYNKKGVLAFAPGLGKTPTAIIIADQLLQKGVVKKPLFIVPANTIPQWENTARELYPNAKVFEFPRYKSGANKGKVKDWVAMNAADKEKMVNDLTNSRYDYTFISANLAQKFTVPESDLDRYIDELTESISGMEKPDSELTKSQIKAKEKRLAKLAMLKTTMMEAFKADQQLGFDMEKLGFDAIFADEVQYYKNIGMQSEDAKGGIGANIALKSKFPIGEDGKPDKNANPIAVSLGSSRSYDFRFKTRYISENNNGNNIFLLTGTPTPNKPLELLTLLHHLDEKILDEYGVNNVSDFIDEFLEVTDVEELDLSGNPVMNAQLTGIKNIDALKKIITRYVDYRSPESAKDLTRPKQVDINHTILRSDDAELVFADIQTRLLKSIEDNRANRRGDIVDDAEATIQMYGAGRDASIDIRLYTPTAKGDLVKPGTLFEAETREDYSKIAKTVALIKKQNAKDPEAGQIVFLDRLKFANNNGSTHAEIRNKILEATSLKPSEVLYVNGGEHVNPNTGAVVKSGPKPERLQQIIDDYNAGKIKVIIGNTAKLGVGVDLQVTTTDVYQIDKPYRPDEIEQRNNRAVRQGNRNAAVRVHTFNQPGTFDDMSDRIIANKQGFNDVFWKDQENDTADVSAQGAPDAYEAAIEIEQDPVKKQKLKIERDLDYAHKTQQGLEKQISNLAKRIKSAKKSKNEYEVAVEGIDTSSTPAYKDQSPDERKKSISEFKSRMKKRREKYVARIADIETDLDELIKNRASRMAELEAHKNHIASIRDKYVVDGRVSLERIKKDSPMLSKSTPKSGSTVDQVKSWLPRRAQKMADLEVVQSVKDLPEGYKSFVTSDGIEGFYDKGEIYLVADMLTKDNVNQVLNHELLHKRLAEDTNLRKQLDSIKAGLRDIFDKIQTGQYKGRYKTLYDEAMARVEAANTPDADRYEEFLAYSVSVFLSKPESIPAKLKQLIQKLIAHVRAALMKYGVNLKNITPADLNALALQAINYDAKPMTESGVMASKVNDYTTWFWKLMGQHDEVYRVKSSSSNSMEDIVKAVDSKIDVRPIVSPSPETIKQWIVDIEQKGKTYDVTKSATISENKEGQVWVNLSALESGKSEGYKIYAIAANYAYNNDKVLIGDPDHISDTAVFRRTENMLSSALKYQTTRHLQPDVRQMVPDNGLEDVVTAIKWEKGNDTKNLKELLQASYNNITSVVPEIKDMTYDFDTQEYLHNGKPITDEELIKLGKDGTARAKKELEGKVRYSPADEFSSSLYGVTSLKRAILTNAVMDGDQGKIFGELSRNLSGKLDDSFNGLLYSRKSNDVINEFKRKAGLGPKLTLKDTINNIIENGLSSNIQAIKNKWTEIKPELEQGIFDKFLGIRLAEQAVLGDVSHSLSGYISARLSTGSSSTMAALLQFGSPKWDGGVIQKKDGSKGFAEILQPVKDDLENFTAWMVARRADRLFKEGKENNFSLDEIKAGLALKKDSYQSVADDIAKMNKSVLDLAQESGLVDADSRKLFESNDYIPFYRLIEGKKGSPSNKKGLSHQSSGIKMLKGGENPMSDPLGNMMQNWAHLIDASMKNDALNKTLINLEGSDFVTAQPRVEFKQALIPKEQIKKLMLDSGLPKEVIDLMPDDVTKGIAKMWAVQAPTKPDVVRVMRDGKSEYFKVNDPLLLASLTAVNQERLGGIFKPMRYMKTLLTGAVTADPTFMARNWIRDSMHSWTIAEEKGFKLGIDSIHGAVKSFKEEGGYIDMMFAGASFQGGYGNYNNPDASRLSMDAVLRKKGVHDIRGFKESILDTPRKYWEMYRSIGDAIENASREAILENSKKAGDEKAKYLFESKDIMDFSMQGSFTLIRAMSDMLPFFNARLVGIYRLAKAGKTKEARNMIMMKGASIAMMSLALLAINSDNDDYEALEDWDKDQYWHFFFGDSHFRIPKPFELGLIFGTIPERSARLLIGTDSLKEFSSRMAHGAGDTLAFNPVPQLFKPFAEIYSNKNMFTGRPIEGMADKNKLPSARYNEFTSESMRVLSSILPEALGASPKRLEHLLHGYLGSLGMYALGASDMVVRGMSGMPPLPEMRIDRLPVIKAFYQEKPQMHTKYGTQFYDMLNEVNQIHSTINAYKKEGKFDEASKLRIEHAGKLRARKQLAMTNKKLKTLRRRVDAIYRSNDTPANKRVKIDSIMNRFNLSVQTAVKRTHPYFD